MVTWSNGRRGKQQTISLCWFPLRPFDHVIIKRAWDGVYIVTRHAQFDYNFHYNWLFDKNLGFYILWSTCDMWLLKKIVKKTQTNYQKSLKNKIDVDFWIYWIIFLKYSLKLLLLTFLLIFHQSFGLTHTTPIFYMILLIYTTLGGKSKITLRNLP